MKINFSSAITSLCVFAPLAIAPILPATAQSAPEAAEETSDVSSLASDHLNKASKALDADNFELAAAHAEAASKISPSARSWGYLAYASNELDKLDTAWMAARECLNLEPESEAAEELFSDIWDRIINLQVLDLGRPYDSVVKDLTAPDESSYDTKAGSGVVHYGYMAVLFEDGKVDLIIDTRNWTGTAPADYSITLNIVVDDWKPGFHYISEDEEVKIFDSRKTLDKNESQKFVWHRYIKPAKEESFSSFRKNWIARLQKANSNGPITITTTEKMKNEFSYVVEIPATEERAAITEFGKIFDNGKDFFRVSFRKNGGAPLTKPERMAWSESIEETQLTPIK